MIPKIIHFCWLSGEEYPQLVKDCLKSWKKHMPEYEVVCWNMEKIADIDNQYMREAISCRKWAFAADFIRFYALYNYGGIYLDSDVFVRSSLEKLSGHRAFSGIEYCISTKERICNIEAAVVGAEPQHPLINDCLNAFNNRKFILGGGGNFDQKIIPEIVAEIAESKYGFKRIPESQLLHEDVMIYSPDIIAHAYLESSSAKDCCAIHLCAGGWYKSSVSKWSRAKSLIRRLLKNPVNTIYMLYWKLRFGKEMK